MTASARPRRGYLILGSVVIFLALWLLLGAAGFAVPELARFWPIFAVLGGVASIADYFGGTRAPASFGRGWAAIGTGALLFAFTYDKVGVFAVGRWWPALPLIAGAGFFATWLAGSRKTPYLVVGLLGLALGVTSGIGRFEWLARVLPAPGVIWGVLLLALGVYLLWKNLRRGEPAG